MGKNRKVASLLAATALALTAPYAAHAQGGKATGAVQLPDNVAPWVAGAQLTGHADPNGRVVVSAYLGLRNEGGLRSFIRDLYTPGTAAYGHYLTPAQFRAAYAPAAADARAVKDFFSAQGLKVEYNPANNMYVDASGTVAQVEKAFGVTENVYSYSGKSLRANAQAPTIPASLASTVSFIGGLDESEQLIAPYNRGGEGNAPPGEGYATPGPCSTSYGDHTATVTPRAYQYGATLPWVVCGYTPAQIRAAYGVDQTKQDGSGVRVGIVDAFASPTIVDDVNRFVSDMNPSLTQSGQQPLPQLTGDNFQQIVTPGTANYPENRFDPQGWYGEESLDVEWVHAMAPGAKIVYAGGQNSNAPLDHALINLIDSGLVDIITNSWGFTGEPKQYGHVQADERAFMQAAAEGISVLFSSGDDGDVAAQTGIAQGSYPATSPYVTSVGGTSLATGDGAATRGEWGWGTYSSRLTGSTVSANGSSVTGSGWTPWPPTYLYGSGGGISLRFAQPDYQRGVVPNSLATSTTTTNGGAVTFATPHRVSPDIAMDADPNTGALYGETYQVANDPLIDAGCTSLGGNREYCERRIGGTSLASPLFAGTLALVDQARFAAGKAAVGFVNPALYGIGAGATNAPIVDVLPPTTPMAELRNTGATGQTTTLRTINSVPTGTSGGVIEGADSSLRTTPGWDDVTGLGAPYAPALVTALSR